MTESAMEIAVDIMDTAEHEPDPRRRRAITESMIVDALHGCRDGARDALLTLLSASVEPYLRRVQAVVEAAGEWREARRALDRAWEEHPDLMTATADERHAAAVRVTEAEMSETAAMAAFDAAIRDLPTNPLERVRALLHEAGRSLDLKREGL